MIIYVFKNHENFLNHENRRIFLNYLGKMVRAGAGIFLQAGAGAAQKWTGSTILPVQITCRHYLN
jgi:hypothetical protein